MYFVVVPHCLHRKDEFGLDLWEPVQYTLEEEEEEEEQEEGEEEETLLVT